MNSNIMSIRLKAIDENLNNVIQFVETFLEDYEVSPKLIMQVDVCVEEMFINVAHYAYTETGDVEIGLAMNEEGVLSITLKDDGIPFDPLAKEDPDTTLSAEERQIGGLGIFMVKKTMDECAYQRLTHSNLFTMRKKVK